MYSFGHNSTRCSKPYSGDPSGGVYRLDRPKRRDVADRVQQAVVVEPPNPFERGEFDVLQRAPRPPQWITSVW